MTPEHDIPPGDDEAPRKPREGSWSARVYTVTYQCHQPSEALSREAVLAVLRALLEHEVAGALNAPMNDDREAVEEQSRTA